MLMKITPSSASSFKARIHHAQPLVVAGQVLALFADDLAQPLLDLRVIDVIVINPALVSCVVGRINVPTDFLIQKALSGTKVPKKA